MLNCNIGMLTVFTLNIMTLKLLTILVLKLASVAQLDARPTGVRSLRVRHTAGSVIFCRGDLSWNIFYGHFLLFADSKRTVVSFWRRTVHMWLGKLTGLDMTPLG